MRPSLPFMAFLQLTAILIEDYDDAIAFFTQALGFDLAKDSPARTNDGHPQRWVVVRPPGAETGILLARADGDHQIAAIGNQHAGRVGFFLRVDDFNARYQRMRAAGVEFLTEPRTEPYGRVVVFRDVAGNRWDLLGPPPLLISIRGHIGRRHSGLTRAGPVGSASRSLTIRHVPMSPARSS
jgi:catechol 2,3-dioxygenase-like lactoylglutathione lyase family enzyme